MAAVDLLWFDHVAGNWRDYRFPELFEMIYRLQPGILVNNRAAAFFQPTVDQPDAGAGAVGRRRFRHAGAAYRSLPERPPVGVVHDDYRLCRRRRLVVSARRPDTCASRSACGCS